MTELGFCTLFWELTGLFFALTVPLSHQSLSIIPMRGYHLRGLQKKDKS